MLANSSWRRLLLLTTGLLLGLSTPALAAPDRLNDEVPDAVMDLPGAFSFSYSHEALKLEGPLNDENIAHDYFKLRYTLNPKTALTFRYGTHNLNGGLGLANPLFDNRDGGESYSFDLALNLLNVAAVPADPETDKEYEAGSAFNVGVSGTLFQMDMGDLASEDSLLRAYLVYTTDLSPEMRAHTIFTTSRLSGDSASGSVNRIGAGLDYTLIDGPRPLTLMANAILDVYNFRQPDFNTSRISRFDVGLRYRVAPSWYTSLGYTTYNDSENDASGSGIFASVQYVDEPEQCITCEPLPAEEQAPAEAQASLDNTVAPAPAAQPKPAAVATAKPPLMKNGTQPAKAADAPGAGQAEKQPAETPKQTPAESEDQGAASETEETPAKAEKQPPADAEGSPPAEAEEPQSTEAEAEQPAGDEEQKPAATEAADESSPAAEAPVADSRTEAGVVIPELPQEQPRQTAPGAVMVRAGGTSGSPAPHYTSADDVLLRASGEDTSAEIPSELVALQDEAEATESPTALLALSTGAAVRSDAAADLNAAEDAPAKAASEADSPEEQ
jgi:hypothetical protein